MTIIAYARVSTDGQTLDAQQSALALAGAERVFAEKVSGAVTDRRALARAIAALGAGDTFVVTKLDRLARSTRDLLNTLDACGRRTGRGPKGVRVALADCEAIFRVQEPNKRMRDQAARVSRALCRTRVVAEIHVQ